MAAREAAALDALKPGLPNWEIGRSEIEADPSFIALRAQHPLQMDLLLAFLSFAHKALEAMVGSGNGEAAQEHVSAMTEVYSWLKGASAPVVDKELAGVFGAMLKADVPMDVAAPFLLSRTKKGKGAPVTNRLPVVLAKEYRILHPKTSWMQLAIKFCPCGKPHDMKCRERLRHQAMEFDDMRVRLGV